MLLKLRNNAKFEVGIRGERGGVAVARRAGHRFRFENGHGKVKR